MYAGDAEIRVTVRVAMAMSMANVFQHMMGSFRVPMAIERHGTLEAHVAAADNQHARHAQRAEALNLAKAQGEAVRRRLEAPRHRRKGEDVRGQVGDAVPGVGNHGLGVEGPAANELGNGHGEVAEQADPGDAHAGVVFVGRGQEGVVMVVMVAEEPVAMAVIVTVVVMVVVAIVVVLVACLASGAHDEGQRADAAAEDGVDVKHGAARRQDIGQRKMAIGRGRQGEGRRDGGRRGQRLQPASRGRLMCPELDLERAKCDWRI